MLEARRVMFAVPEVNALTRTRTSPAPLAPMMDRAVAVFALPKTTVVVLLPVTGSSKNVAFQVVPPSKLTSAMRVRLPACCWHLDRHPSSGSQF